jgi:hypothetical protein
MAWTPRSGAPAALDRLPLAPGADDGLEVGSAGLERVEIGEAHRADELADDEDLALRVREQLAGEPGVTEKAMFGGLAAWVQRGVAFARSLPAKG